MKGFITNRNGLLTVLEAEVQDQGAADPVSHEDCWWPSSWLAVSSHGGRGRELSGVSL